MTSTLSESAGAETQKLADSIRAGVRFLANQRLDISLAKWNDLSNRFLRAADLLDTLAAPVQAEPVAWRWRYRTSSIWNVSDCDVTSATMCAPEFIIERLYASPPTPVLGEAEKEILRIVRQCLIEYAPNCSGQLAVQIDYARRDIQKAIRKFYATPLSAGLDDTAPSILVKSEKS